MRVPAQCPQCRQGYEQRQSMYEVSSGARGRELPVVSVKEMDAADVHSGKLTLSCREGHETVVTLSIPAFELLFDFGCSALLDGYPREAITTFASSFERFQEFTCRFLLARRNVDPEGVDHWWKEVSRQSERQMGSFLALWITEFRSEPPALPNPLIALRNSCVHRGRIPPDSEAKAYGEAVLRAEVGGIVALRNCFDSALDYDNFVDYHIIRPGENEPLLMSFLEHTVISGMWRPNEPRPDTPEAAEDQAAEDEEWGFQIDRTDKNTTDPTRLTMDRALQVFAGLRAFGVRRT